MLQGLAKGIDLAVVCPVSPHTLDYLRIGNRLLLAPDLLTGLVVFAMRTLCKFPAHWAPLVLQQLQHKEDANRDVLTIMEILLALNQSVALAQARGIEEKLKGSWGGCDGVFHKFHQVLHWLSCLRSSTKRHALGLPSEFVSPDTLCHYWWVVFFFRDYRYVDCLGVPY